MESIFDPQILVDDLCEVHRIYANFFSTLKTEDWEKPVKPGSKEWTLHETIAHLCALTGAGLESIQYTLRGENIHLTVSPTVIISSLTTAAASMGNFPCR